MALPSSRRHRTGPAGDPLTRRAGAPGARRHRRRERAVRGSSRRSPGDAPLPPRRVPLPGARPLDRPGRRCLRPRPADVVPGAPGAAPDGAVLDGGRHRDARSTSPRRSTASPWRSPPFPCICSPAGSACPAAAALSCAAATVVAPGLLYASYMTADAVAYLLALVAVLVAVRALSRPTRGNAGLVPRSPQGSRRSRGSSTPCSFPPSWARHSSSSAGTSCGPHAGSPSSACAVALPASPAAVLGSRVLGRYEAVTELRRLSVDRRLGRLDRGAARRRRRGSARPGRRGVDRDVVRARRGATGPGPASPRSPALRSSGSWSPAAVMSVDTGSDRFLERYLIVRVPARRDRVLLLGSTTAAPAASSRSRVAALVIVAAARVPVSGQLTGQGSADSPTLLAAEQARRDRRPRGGEPGRRPRRLRVRRARAWRPR